jgi:hypothetical protein
MLRAIRASENHRIAMSHAPQISPVPAVSRIDHNHQSYLSRVSNFFRSRWRGEAPLAITFWCDMLLVGTALNVPVSLIAILLDAAGAPAGVVLGVFFALLPWNLFLFLAVWRCASKAAPISGLAAKTGAAVWLTAVSII